MHSAKAALASVWLLSNCEALSDHPWFAAGMCYISIVSTKPATVLCAGPVEFGQHDAGAAAAVPGPRVAGAHGACTECTVSNCGVVERSGDGCGGREGSGSGCGVNVKTA
eukprot:2954649-Pleurochrysis_carterae.AAC.2